MSSTSYEDKLKVMQKLLESGLMDKKGVTTIKVGDVEVTRSEYVQATQGVPINISVAAQATAITSVDISTNIQEILKQLEARNIERQKLEEAKEQLESFARELQRAKPRWPQIRKILKWGLGLGQEIFLRLVVTWVQRCGQGGFGSAG